MSLFSSWMNLNELRSYPVSAEYECGIPPGFISDMQIFLPEPRNEYVDSAGKINIISRRADILPILHSAAVTRHLATVVVKCDNCVLFCTKNLDSIVPYEPVKFVSESDSCVGWVAFGAFDKSFQFSYTTDGTAGRLDPRAVVFYPSSTIGGFSVPAFSDKLCGNITILGGRGVDANIDKESNSIVLSLSDDVSDIYSDPCSRQKSKTEFPAVCSIDGVSSNNGSIVLAFTGKKMSADDIVAASARVANINQNNVVSLSSEFERSDGFDYVKVRVDPAENQQNDSGFCIIDYRLVYEILDPGAFDLLRRDTEFSIGAGYHRPLYDIWTRPEFLPKLAELYRQISIVGTDNESIIANPLLFDPFPWDISLEKHGYELEYLNGVPRYDDSGVPVEPDETILLPPYESLESHEINNGNGVVFAHRIKNSLPAEQIVSIFAEVVYKPLKDNAASSIARCTVYTGGTAS